MGYPPGAVPAQTCGRIAPTLDLFDRATIQRGACSLLSGRSYAIGFEGACGISADGGRSELLGPSRRAWRTPSRATVEALRVHRAAPTWCGTVHRARGFQVFNHLPEAHVAGTVMRLNQQTFAKVRAHVMLGVGVLVLIAYLLSR